MWYRQELKNGSLRNAGNRDREEALRASIVWSVRIDATDEDADTQITRRIECSRAFIIIHPNSY